jgi:hypothetical protein
MHRDIDGDGLFERSYSDTDNDGDLDQSTINRLDPWVPSFYQEAPQVELEELEFDYEKYYEENDSKGTYYQRLDNFDPRDADKDGVIGEPDEALSEWEFQGDTMRCALYSQMFVIEEFTDHEVDMEAFADYAESKGWFDERYGTPLNHMNKMLNYYGVENELSYNNDMDDIQECLEQGGRIIVALDADEMWYAENDDIYVPGDGVNHAVEVIGLDLSDPDNPVVILNDSGTPNGQGVEIPLEVFMDAWEDGNNMMIECYDTN